MAECLDRAMSSASLLLSLSGGILTALAIVAAFAGGSQHGFNLGGHLFRFAALLSLSVTVISGSAGWAIKAAGECAPGTLDIPTTVGLCTGILTLPIASWWIAKAVYK